MEPWTFKTLWSVSVTSATPACSLKKIARSLRLTVLCPKSLQRKTPLLCLVNKSQLGSQVNRTSSNQLESSSWSLWLRNQCWSVKTNLVLFWTWCQLVLTATPRSVPQSKACSTHQSSSSMHMSTQTLSDSVKTSSCTDPHPRLSHRQSQLLWEQSALKPWKHLWEYTTTLTLFWSCSWESKMQFSSKLRCHSMSSTKSWLKARNVRVSQPIWLLRESTLQS